MSTSQVTREDADLGNSEPLLQRVAPRAAHAQPRAILELHLVIAAGAAMHHLDEVEPDDDGALGARLLGEEALVVVRLHEVVDSGDKNVAEMKARVSQRRAAVR